MNRLDRLTSILVQLQSKRLITAREIADRFEVSIRTIYRDIHSLRNAGVPIGEEEGRGYFLVNGYNLPPIMFNPEEANALIAVEKILDFYSDESLRKTYQSALLKIKSVMKSAQQGKLEYLEQRIAHYTVDAPRSKYLMEIQNGITENIKLHLVYHSKTKDETTKRTIHPYALYLTGFTWSVIGLCELRKELREFRIDRIKSMKMSSDNFLPDQNFKLDQYLSEREKKIFNP